MLTASFYTLSTVCQYPAMNRLLFLCPYVHCCLLHSVHCLSVPQTVPSVSSVSLCPLLPSTVHFLSVPHNVPSFGSVSQCPLLPSTVCTLSVNTSHYIVCIFCVTMSSAAFYNLSTVCQYLTLNRLLVLCHYVHCCFLYSVQYLPLPHMALS
jgi:hypothetical protein